MISLDLIISLVLILTGALATLYFSLPKHARAGGLRAIRALQNLRRAIGLSVEEGKRLHVSLGNSSILGPNNASALVGLSALEQAARISLVGDRPPVATSGDGTLAILSQDTLQAAYRTNHATAQYDPDRGRLAGVTPFSYTAGVIPILSGEQISANLLVGYYGPEIALICEAAERQGAFVLAGSESLPAQAALYATAQEPLIGEELFAIPAYLQASPVHQASLKAQDVLRWVLILLLIAGAALKLVESVFGAPLL
ncbi:MAG: hypothetical protein IT308_11175 [Anaerolineaceae bacterium]|nr:hypothetical protein [Anaerolineaceae bacterium]